MLKLKWAKILIIFCISLVISCSQPGITEKPNKNIEPTVKPVLEKKVGAIGATILFDPFFFRQTNVITVSIINPLDNKVLVSKEFNDLKPTFEFIINDIPIPDGKDELDVTVKILGYCCKGNYKSKLIKNQVTKLDPIKYEHDKDFDPLFYNRILGIVVDENGNPIEGATVSNITGGELHKENKPGDSTPRTSDSTTRTLSGGNFSFYSSVYPVTLEISANGKIMKIIVPKESSVHVDYKLISNARTISGQVFDAKDKTKVLPDIKVKILNEDIISKTDSNGKFELRGVPLNQVTVIVNDSVNIPVSKADNSNEVKLEPIFVSK